MMRRPILAVTVFAVVTVSPPADRAADRRALLAADSALVVSGDAFTDSGAYLHPGAPLVRGANNIRAYLASDTSIRNLPRAPAFGDVSADGSFGYTWGWTPDAGTRGKYLACWRKGSKGWRLAAYVHTTQLPDSTPLSAPTPAAREPSAPVRGKANRRELLRADSAFSALSVKRGAKQAFSAYAADEAVSFGSGAQITEGRQAIGAAFDAFPAGAVLQWRPLGADIAGSGDLGCTVGEATVASLHHYSKYLTVWKRQPGGKWKFVADGGNARPAPALTH